MTTPPAPEQGATYREVLANPRFRLLFLTRTLTITADSLRIMTLSVLVFGTTGSPLLGALAFGIGFLPQLLGSFFLGSLADRLRPRRLIIAGYGFECAAAATMGLTHLPVTAILLLIAAVACLTPVFGGVSNRLVAETLSGDAYVLGRSMYNMSASAAQLLGLAGGGIAVALLGPRHALLVSAGGYAVAAVAIRLRLPDLPAPNPPAPEQAAAPGGARKDSDSVMRHSWSRATRLFADRRVRRLLIAQWLPPAFVAGAESLIVPFAGSRDLPAGASGPLLACLPMGMLAGDLAIGRFVRPAARERFVVALVAVLGLPLVGFVLDPPYAVCAVLLLISGTGFAYGLGLQRDFLDALPEESRGQAFGLLTSGLMSFQGVAPVVLGAAAEFTDAGAAMAMAGVATLCMVPYLVRTRNAT
ncbi:MFS transporter [Streptomyces sp. NPDC059850]|uniref:MFS transporter n=1 Tax=Streptomyces sp. NPDC059850 TaxID=3346970 RepID=UPI0036610BF0